MLLLACDMLTMTYGQELSYRALDTMFTLPENAS
jgi:hypothetical protein